jgi:lysophospholipase L1-like esterase
MNLRKSWKQSKSQRSRPRNVLFYLTAMVIVISPLALGELVLRLCVPAPPIALKDPYVSFSSLRPLFSLDSNNKRFKTVEERLGAFRPQSFSATKAPKSFRIFCLGGSTVQGRPYSVETSFTSWLELNLRAAQSEVDYKVINCGGISYASYRLIPIMRELIEYEPDLFIIYTGHNEFLEDRTYEHIKKMPRVLLWLHDVLLNLRSYAFANQFLSRHRVRDSSKTILPTKVQTKLDLQNGLESYHRDKEWRRGTIAHFRRNLETIVQMSRRASAPIILMKPVSNLKNCPPFKSECRSDLSDRERKLVVELRERAGKIGWDNTYGKIKLLEQAASIDNRHAGLMYLLGKCHERIGRFAEAKKWFVRAKEEDVCPLRILVPMHEIIQDVAAKYKVQLVDVKTLIEERTEDGIPGDEWLLDHIHPSIACHQLIADALYQTMEDMKILHTPEDWRATRDELWQHHLSSLDKFYYARGAARLKRLRQWSRGHIPKE